MKILVVDDDPAARLMLDKQVRHLGHECVTSAGGEDAWDRFQEERPDVVVSDWLMPGLDGIELCKRIRDHEAAYTRFILVTAMGDQEHALKGVRAGADDFLSKPVDRHDLEIRLVAAARVGRLHRQVRDYQQALEHMNAQLYQQARLDPLTLLGNRLRLQEDLNLLKPRVESDEASFCIALFDLDRFKDYNDTYGHLQGDVSLKTIARLIADGLRSGDAAYRFGGEEFLVILYDVTEHEARIAVDRIRSSVEALCLPHSGNTAGHQTISAGLSRAVSVGLSHTEKLVEEADEALYRAKEKGGNRVEMADLSARECA